MVNFSACASRGGIMNTFTKLRLSLLVLALAAVWTALTPVEALNCPHYFCRTNDECSQKCPSAVAAACIENVCQYSYTTGGGGGGGNCPHPFCTSDATCQQACPSAAIAQCVNSACQYF
jgi:hypothetical protein